MKIQNLVGNEYIERSIYDKKNLSKTIKQGGAIILINDYFFFLPTGNKYPG